MPPYWGGFEFEYKTSLVACKHSGFLAFRQSSLTGSYSHFCKNVLHCFMQHLVFWKVNCFILLNNMPGYSFWMVKDEFVSKCLNEMPFVCNVIHSVIDFSRFYRIRKYIFQRFYCITYIWLCTAVSAPSVSEHMAPIVSHRLRQFFWFLENGCRNRFLSVSFSYVRISLYATWTELGETQVKGTGKFQTHSEIRVSWKG